MDFPSSLWRATLSDWVRWLIQGLNLVLLDRDWSSFGKQWKESQWHLGFSLLEKTLALSIGKKTHINTWLSDKYNLMPITMLEIKINSLQNFLLTRTCRFWFTELNKLIETIINSHCLKNIFHFCDLSTCILKVNSILIEIKFNWLFRKLNVFFM